MEECGGEDGLKLKVVVWDAIRYVCRSSDNGHLGDLGFGPQVPENFVHPKFVGIAKMIFFFLSFFLETTLKVTS